ncbi:MAG: class I SAM-dependent methyltransferase [Bacteroidetes bacterium]|nr:class I SAM-dependent methyltransferase [Bacteroidota bacterium]
MTDFKDHFSPQSDDYAKYRPGYPSMLFEVILDHVNDFDLAWDCATGNGQAARELAPHFSQVFATDASEKQIANAHPISNVEFLVSPAENTPFQDHSFDLITVAQAAHWFDLSAFYREVKRVMKPGGILAMWTYTLFETVPKINRIIEEFYFEVVFKYWPPERRLVEAGYSTLYFPFEPIKIPDFYMYMNWNYEEMIGYLNTWSAVKNYRQEKHEDPIDLIDGKLQAVWGNPETRYRLKWEIPMLVTRIG